MYDRLAAALAARHEWLAPFDRDVLLESGAHEAVTEGVGPPFNLRPALFGEMLELYDELRRHQQDIEHFERLLATELEPHASSDRGAERVLRQTRFLAAAFRSYQREVRARGALDEHELRDLLLAGDAVSPWRRAIVTAGDRVAERGGLWPADFDLLARLPGLEQLDVIATEAQLAAGFHVRVHGLLPGIEEVRFDEPPDGHSGPVLEVPSDGARHFTSRDREEELIGVMRRVSGRHRPSSGDRLDRTAIIFARPLPYLYLAHEVFTSAGLPFQSGDALPLAAEPAAAAVDVLLTFVSSGASHDATMALLSSPHFTFCGESPGEWQKLVGELDVALGEAGYTGGVDRLRSLAGEWAGRPAATAARAAVEAADLLQPLLAPAAAATHLATLKRFIEEREPQHLTERELRSRRAVRTVLDGLTTAYGRRSELTWTIEQLAATVRRWLESQTFEPRTGDTGIHLVDAVAARYCALEEAHLVGLVDGEWPERRRRNIFYSSFLLKRLGWTDDTDPMAAHRAAFSDLLHLATRRTTVSTVQLEDDALVEPSPLLEELRNEDLETHIADVPAASPTADELLLARTVPASLAAEPAGWVRLRQGRTASSSPEFHGRAAPHRRREYGVGSIELYAHCPFKYFARHVLGLQEEIEEEDALSPRDRGIFVHEVLHAFFERWHASGRAGITPDLLDSAEAMLEEVAEPMLARLAPSDASIERARLFGSAVAPGIADLVLRMEAERPTAVLGRQLEERFSGRFDLATGTGVRSLAIRGIADRIDLLADGSLRVLDYKSSVPLVPLQLAIYAATAVQRLRAEQARQWTLGEVSYVVYGGRRGIKPLARSVQDLERAVADAQQRFVDAVDAIESGQFPPRPAHVRLCGSCSYATICRKEYVVDPHEPDAPTAV